MSHQTKNLVKTLYKNDDGEPFILTEGQEQIFDAIFKREHKRVHILTYTQFGKSNVVAQAILTRVSSIPDKYVIIAPSDKKANIIMGYLIGHIFDNELTKTAFDVEKGESLERIRRERNKKHLTFRTPNGIGEVLAISCEGKRTKDILSTLLGFGGRNLILDESPTVSEEHYAGVLRMLGGHKDNMLVEIGNAINRNHFYKASRDPTYQKIKIDYEQGIAEGRQTPEFFAEMKRKMLPSLFTSLYECKFPDENAMDADGYLPLVTDKALDASYVDDVYFVGDKMLGVDVASGGRNKSVIALRSRNAGKVIFESDTSDTMSLTSIVVRLAKENDVRPSGIFVDCVGVGKGLYDRLVEILGIEVNGVNVGMSADEDGYINKRAEAYYALSDWLKSGGQLVRHEGFEELANIRYKIQSDKKIKIIGKDELLRRGILSPDYADALMLTFAGGIYQSGEAYQTTPDVYDYSK